MSGEDVKAKAGVAEGRGEVPDVETEVAVRSRGPKRARRLKPGGPPSKLDARVEAIVAKVREIGPAATRLLVAQELGRVDKNWGAEETSDYKRDVSAAGGWAAIMRRAGF